MKRSLEVNFRGASTAQRVKGNKNEPDSAAWYWKLMYGGFMSSPHEFTSMSAWLYYHLEGKLSQQTNTGRAITTEDHLRSGCDGRERNQKDSPSRYVYAITHLKTNLSFKLLVYSSGLLPSVCFGIEGSLLVLKQLKWCSYSYITNLCYKLKHFCKSTYSGQVH